MCKINWSSEGLHDKYSCYQWRTFSNRTRIRRQKIKRQHSISGDKHQSRQLTCSYLMAGEDERRPHEEARHGPSCGGHEEDGLVQCQQLLLGDPRHVGPRWSRRGGGAGGGGGQERRVLAQPLGQRHVSPPHLPATRSVSSRKTNRK